MAARLSPTTLAARRGPSRWGRRARPARHPAISAICALLHPGSATMATATILGTGSWCHRIAPTPETLARSRILLAPPSKVIS
eukprot:1175935-Pyramimonas_sp.AAC.1